MSEAVINFLRPNGLVVAVWEMTVLLFALFLIGLAVLIFIRREAALGFLSKFASTPRINALESVLRFVTGLALVGASPDLRFSQIAYFFGLMMAVTSVPMILLPNTHARYGKWSMKILPRILPLYATVAFTMGAFILYALM